MKRKIFPLLVMALLFVFLAANPQAEEKKIKATMTTIKDNLQLHLGKRVELILESGQKISGTVARIGDHVVHIEKITGKEFYDAVLKIGTIDAVVFRARER